MTAHERMERDDASSAVPSEPERLGQYRLLEEIGEGGMGVVHLAVDRRGRAVAIKALRPHVAHDRDARTRLIREVETLSRIRDQRVATVIDADVTGPRPFIVTRWVPGPSLDEVVDEHGPLPPHDLLRLARGMAEAIGAIHACGVVHRDIKPGNVLLEDGEPVLIDFGIAHLQDDVRHTVGGLVMGTPGYLSPELVEGAEITDATDWWGWAATITYAASGRPPFGRGRMDAVLARVRAGQVDLEGVDPRLVPLLQASLSPRPKERPHADAVIDALERYAMGYAATVPTPTGQVWDDPGLHNPYGSTEVLHASSTAVMPPSGFPPAAPPAVAPVPTPPFGVPVSAQSHQAAQAAQAAQAQWPPPAAPAQHAPARPAAYGASPLEQRWEPEAEDEYWEEEWDDEDEWEEEEPYTVRSESDPRIGKALRTSALLGLGIGWLGVVAAWPGVAVVALVVWSSFARAADRSMTGLVLRRHDRGRRPSDVPWAVVTSPWHFVLGIVATAVTLLLPALLAAAGVFASALLLAGMTGSEVEPGTPVTLVIGAAMALLLLWWGAGGAPLRRGSRSIVRALLPAGSVAQVVGWVLAGGGIVLVLLSGSRGTNYGWWPWQSGPFGL
jgi:serine/threonine protein kinase